MRQQIQPWRAKTLTCIQLLQLITRLAAKRLNGSSVYLDKGSGIWDLHQFLVLRRGKVVHHRKKYLCDGLTAPSKTREFS